LRPQPNDPVHNLSYFLCQEDAAGKTGDDQWRLLVQWLQWARNAGEVDYFRIQDCYPGTQTYKVSVFVRNTEYAVHVDMKEMTKELGCVMYVHEQ
jgi:hypothetical protein